MSLAQEIAEYLEDESLGTVGTDIFWGLLPATPDTAIAVLEYAGEPTVKAMGITRGGAVLERPRFQVVCRAAAYATARTNAQSCWTKLDGHSGTLEGVEYLFIEALQSPFSLGRDENERARVVCNYTASKRLS